MKSRCRLPGQREGWLCWLPVTALPGQCSFCHRMQGNTPGVLEAAGSAVSTAHPHPAPCAGEGGQHRLLQGNPALQSVFQQNLQVETRLQSPAHGGSLGPALHSPRTAAIALEQRLCCPGQGWPFVLQRIPGPPRAAGGRRGPGTRVSLKCSGTESGVKYSAGMIQVVRLDDFTAEWQIIFCCIFSKARGGCGK